jgi:hypothetical protein
VVVEHILFKEEGAEDELEGTDALELEAPLLNAPLLVSALLVPRFAFVASVVALVEASRGGRGCPKRAWEDVPPSIGKL